MPLRKRGNYCTEVQNQTREIRTGFKAHGKQVRRHENPDRIDTTAAPHPFRGFGRLLAYCPPSSPGARQKPVLTF